MQKQTRINRTLVVTIVSALIIVASGMAGCAASGPAGRAMAASAAADAVQSPGEGMGELVQGNTAFALDLYRVLFDEGRNLSFSPHSLSAALALAYAGARGPTEQQMAGVLHFTLPQDQLHPAFNVLSETLASRDEREEAQDLKLHLASALWGQQGYAFLDTFRESMAGPYGAGLRTVDYRRTEEARRLINQWASTQTEGGVPELVPPDVLSQETVLVLASAAYFQAPWLYPFAGDRTHDGAFTLLDGGRVTVPMMEQVAGLRYAERPGVQAVELPYAGGDLSMIILLPEAGTFETFARGLRAENLDGLLSGLRPTGVRLNMPRFRVDAGFRLKEPLMALGMVDAFGPADFSGIDGTRELFLGEVCHQAVIMVDEAGTEAAGASGTVVLLKGDEGAVEQEVTVDRPFIFLIRDLESGAVLFLGQVVNPAT